MGRLMDGTKYPKYLKFPIALQKWFWTKFGGDVYKQTRVFFLCEKHYKPPAKEDPAEPIQKKKKK